MEFDFDYDGLGFATLAFNNISGIGRGGTGVFKVDGKEVATQKLDHTVPLTLPWDETFDIGMDTGTPGGRRRTDQSYSPIDRAFAIPRQSSGSVPLPIGIVLFSISWFVVIVPLYL